jgi:hypothetical protein
MDEFPKQIIMGWLSLLTAPLSFLYGLTVTSLSYLLASLLFIASPVIYVGRIVLYLTLLPLQILIKLEVCDEKGIKPNRIRCYAALGSAILLTSNRHSFVS